MVYRTIDQKNHPTGHHQVEAWEVPIIEVCFVTDKGRTI